MQSDKITILEENGERERKEDDTVVLMSQSSSNSKKAGSKGVGHEGLEPWAFEKN